MPITYRVPILCPLADKAAVEADLSAHGSYPLSVELCPWPGDPSESAAHAGANISCVEGSDLHTLLLSLPTTYAGVEINPVGVKQYKAWQHWTAWLNSNGLQVRVEA